MFSELVSWYRGTENHHFSVEKGVSQEIQLNLDVVVATPCDMLRVNMQDAAGDFILAAELLQKEETSWDAWNREMNFKGKGGSRQYQTLDAEDEVRLAQQEEDQHVGHVLGEVRRSWKRKFPSAPKLKRKDVVDSCRIFGTLEGNKVQANFHITPMGLGLYEPGGGMNLNSMFLCNSFFLQYADFQQ